MVASAKEIFTVFTVSLSLFVPSWPDRLSFILHLSSFIFPHLIGANFPFIGNKIYICVKIPKDGK